MSTITELKHALCSLSAPELESMADWLECEVEESRYRAFHVREAKSEYVSEEEALFMTWEEYLAFEEQSPYRHEYVNGTVYSMSGASLAHNRIAQKLVIGGRRRSPISVSRLSRNMCSSRRISPGSSPTVEQKIGDQCFIRKQPLWWSFAPLDCRSRWSKCIREY